MASHGMAGSHRVRHPGMCAVLDHHASHAVEVVTHPGLRAGEVPGGGHQRQPRMRATAWCCARGPLRLAKPPPLGTWRAAGEESGSRAAERDA